MKRILAPGRYGGVSSGFSSCWLVRLFVESSLVHGRFFGGSFAGRRPMESANCSAVAAEEKDGGFDAWSFMFAKTAFLKGLGGGREEGATWK